MDYATLGAEVAKPEYDGMDAQAVADAINAKNIPAVVDVETAVAKGILLGTGEWGGLVIFAETPQTDPQMNQARAVAITTRDTLLHTQVMETSKPQYLAAALQMIGVMEQATIFSAGTAQALRDMPNVMQSRADQLGLGQVSDQDVLTVRRIAEVEVE